MKVFELVQQCLHTPVWDLSRELFFFSLDMLRLEYLQAQVARVVLLNTAELTLKVKI